MFDELRIRRRRWCLSKVRGWSVSTVGRISPRWWSLSLDTTNNYVSSHVGDVTPVAPIAHRAAAAVAGISWITWPEPVGHRSRQRLLGRDRLCYGDVVKSLTMLRTTYTRRTVRGTAWRGLSVRVERRDRRRPDAPERSSRHQTSYSKFAWTSSTQHFTRFWRSSPTTWWRHVIR